jgi:hypothetical protein
MKILCCVLVILFSSNIVVGQPAIHGDTNDMSADSTLKILYEHSAKLAIEMESWSPEELKQFKETFIHKRGHITRHKEPIQLGTTAANTQRTNVKNLQLASGCPYFRIVNTSNYPLIARGPIAGRIIYCASQIQDTVMTKAYNNGIPFTGLATNTDSSGHLLGNYIFKNGLIQKIEEFTPQGMTLISLNYINGLAHGESKQYNSDGRLRFLVTYNLGQRDGKFYTLCYTDDPICSTSVKEGYYECGEEVILSKQCE